jgi:hypothetical protein
MIAVSNQCKSILIHKAGNLSVSELPIVAYFLIKISRRHDFAMLRKIFT